MPGRNAEARESGSDPQKKQGKYLRNWGSDLGFCVYDIREQMLAIMIKHRKAGAENGESQGTFL